MAQGASGPGLEVFARDQQWARSTQIDIYNRMGRKPSLVPQHLSRVLYIPSHNNAAPHLPLYDVSERFFKLVGDAPMGGSLFTTKVSIMKKPAGDGTDGDVQYLIDVANAQTEAGNQGSMVIQKRELEGGRPEVTLTLPPARDGFSLKISSTNPYKTDIRVHTSYPDIPTPAGLGACRYPYFSFSLPSGPTVYEWRVRPAEDGPLRYTLIEQDKDVSDTANIIAIYHHIGIGTSLALPHSEGVLLLSESEGIQAAGLDLATVATILGLLWRLREMDPKLQRAAAKQRSHSRSDGSDKKSFFRRAFHKG